MSENSLDQIKLEIKFFSTLKNFMGQDKLEMQVNSGVNLNTILDDLQKEYFIPKDARLLKADGQSLETGVICLINDADISLLGGLHQKITKSIVITLISSLHGG